MISKKYFILLIFVSIFFIPFSAKGSIDIVIVSPPGIFNLSGSETNITQVCTLGEALNIVLDVTGKNKIVFNEPIVDMCDKNTIENLDNYIQMDKNGEISIDSESLSYLKDKSAVVTMRNLNFEEEPDIEVDGKLATSQDIANKTWDQDSGVLTFEAKHFTTYKAVVKSSVIGGEGPSNGKSVPYQFDNIEILLLVFIFIIVIIVSCYLLYKLIKIFK
jgi:hypothetical protein